MFSVALLVGWPTIESNRVILLHLLRRISEHGIKNLEHLHCKNVLRDCDMKASLIPIGGDDTIQNAIRTTASATITSQLKIIENTSVCKNWNIQYQYRGTAWKNKNEMKTCADAARQ